MSSNDFTRSRRRSPGRGPAFAEAVQLREMQRRIDDKADKVIELYDEGQAIRAGDPAAIQKATAELHDKAIWQLTRLHQHFASKIKDERLKSKWAECLDVIETPRREQIGHLTAQLEAAQQEIRLKTEQTQLIQQTLTDQTRKLTQLDADFKNLRICEAELLTSNKSLEQELQTSRDELRKEVDTSDERMREFANQSTSVRESLIEDLIATRNELETEIVSRRHWPNMYQEELDELRRIRQELKQTSDANRDLEGDRQMMQAKIKQLETRKSELGSTLQTTQINVDRLKGRCRELQAQQMAVENQTQLDLTDQMEALASFEAVIDEQSIQLDNLKLENHRLSGVTSKLQTVDDEIAFLEQQTMRRQTTLFERLDESRAETQDLLHLLTEKDKDISTEQETNKSLREQTGALDDQISAICLDLKNKLYAFQESETKKQETIKKLNIQLRHLIHDGPFDTDEVVFVAQQDGCFTQGVDSNWCGG